MMYFKRGLKNIVTLSIKVFMWADFHGFTGGRHYHPALKLGVLLTLIHKANQTG
jgi:hypothetical protein